MEEHHTITLIDIAFGAGLGILVSFLMEIFMDLPGLVNSGLNLRSILNLSAYSTAFSLTVGSTVVIKWALYRETIVKALVMEPEAVGKFLSENFTPIMLYIVTEFAFMFSPVIYYSFRKLYLISYQRGLVRGCEGSGVRLAVDSLLYGLILTLNYVGDVYVTVRGGLYSKLLNEIKGPMLRKRFEYLVKWRHAAFNLALLAASVMLWAVPLPHITSLPGLELLTFLLRDSFFPDSVILAIGITLADMAGSIVILRRISKIGRDEGLMMC